MIPKRIRRKIKVKGQEWEYCVTGRWCADVFLHNLQTNEKLKWYMEGDGIAITPKDICYLIEHKEFAGIKAKTA